MPYWDEQRDAGNFRNSEFLRDFGGPGDERGVVVGVDPKLNVASSWVEVTLELIKEEKKLTSHTIL
jgi:hypothetical protein